MSTEHDHDHDDEGDEPTVCCDACGDEHPEDDVEWLRQTRDHAEGYYCPECLTACDSCGDSIPNESTYSVGWETYCETCYCESFSHCDSCDRVIHNEDARYSDWGTYCEGCYHDEDGEDAPTRTTCRKCGTGRDHYHALSETYLCDCEVRDCHGTFVIMAHPVTPLAPTAGVAR